MSERHRQKSLVALRRELARVKQAMVRCSPRTDFRAGELYGAMQALEWALGHNAMAPAKAATIGWTRKTP